MNRIITYPEKGLLALRGEIPGVDIDTVGAVDHLSKVDARIRRLKEIMRCVIADPPYELPIKRRDDLVIYASKRKNSRKTNALNDNVAPRVRFTGLKIDCTKKYGVCFGDYVEAYRPKVQSSTMQPRTEPCIALYPAGNVSGSWIFWSLESKAYIRRTNFTKLATTQHVINIKNVLAGVTGISKVQQMDAEEEHAAMKDKVVLERELEEEIITSDIPHPNIIEPNSGEVEAEGEVVQSVTGEEEIPTVPQVGDTSVDTVNYGRGLRRGSAPDSKNLTNLTEEDVWVLTQFTAKKGLAKHGKLTMDSINKEFTMLLHEKEAIAPAKRKYIRRKCMKNRVRSSVFLKEKVDGNNMFEKLKTRVVADVNTQDKTLYNFLKSTTAKLESIFVCMALVSGRKNLHWGKIDI